MTLTRPAPVAAPGSPSVPGRPPRAASRAYAELPPTADAAARALRLDALLGDPDDADNPYCRADRGALDDLPVPDGLREEFVPPAAGGHFTSGEELARALRPLFRRTWRSVRPGAYVRCSSRTTVPAARRPGPWSWPRCWHRPR